MKNIRYRNYGRNLFLLFALLSTALHLGCLDHSDPPQALRQAAKSEGPTVFFDLDTRPFPEIPFPNNLATRVDPSSPTGLRINISERGTTRAEDEVRKAINQYTGFGVTSPIWVRFSHPIDYRDVAARHQEATPNLQDDAVYVVNVDPRSKNYGELILCDLGRGNFPVLAAKPDPKDEFPNPPNPDWNNLLLENLDEKDLNGNGILDPIEDLDDDGVWDKPNVYDSSKPPNAPHNMLDFYEKETNTLILKPLAPLDSGTTYAVVLTEALKGENGEPINSPFAGINHARQTKELEPLREILPQKIPARFDKSLKNVRFAWSFTTGTPEETLLKIREGLYGSGPLKWLKEKYPPTIDLLFNGTNPDSTEPTVTRLEPLFDNFEQLLKAQGYDVDTAVLIKQLEDIDYIVSGSFLSPNFLADDDGHASTGLDAMKQSRNPADLDEYFRINLTEGKAYEQPAEVTFVCSVPKAKEGRKPPFQTMIYSHAISSTRLENIIFASVFAKFGIAACTIDAVHHGLAIQPALQQALKGLLSSKGYVNFSDVVFRGRARDANNDGILDSGPDYFNAHLLHSRDNIRQTAVDQMNLIRILRTFDGKKRFGKTLDPSNPRYAINPSLVAPFDANNDGETELAGDFNGDGVVDFGGPDTPYLSFGTSLGGVQTALLAGYDPVVRVAATNAGGGYLSTIAARTIIPNVRYGALLQILGPLLVGNVDSQRMLHLSWYLGSGKVAKNLRFAQIPNVDDGDKIVLTNETLKSERPWLKEDDYQSYAYVRNGRVRLAVAADAADSLTRRASLKMNPSVHVDESYMQCSTGILKCGGTSDCDSSSSCVAGSCIPYDDCLNMFDYKEYLSLLKDELKNDSSLQETINDFSSHVVEDATRFGDRLVIRIYDSSGNLKETINTFQQNVVFENILYPKGSPLAALVAGWGQKQQTPKLRKFFSVAQMLIEPADPIIAMKHARNHTFKYPYESPLFQDGKTNLLITGTLGDRTVPIANQLTLARTAGIINLNEIRADLNMTENQFLVTKFVYEGLAAQNRFALYPNTLFDPDDLDQGRFRIKGAPLNFNPNPDAKPPLRVTVKNSDNTIDALRLAYLKTTGAHTYNVPDTKANFVIETYMTNSVGWYLSNWGRSLQDDLCLEKTRMDNCSFYKYDNYTPPKF